MGRREIGRQLTGSVLSFALYTSMAFVYLSASGYSFSSMELLKRVVKMGVRKGARSLMMAGLILKMSLALLLLMAWSTLVTSGSVTWCSVKSGLVVVVSCSSSFSM